MITGREIIGFATLFLLIFGVFGSDYVVHTLGAITYAFRIWLIRMGA
jgi:hypothetical protein